MKKIGFLSALLIAGSQLWAQVDVKAPFPIDPAIRKGKLENGLTYYVRHNAQPEKRVELRLAVNAGSILETDAQQGLAHFVEHMCFNGTKKFPKQDLVNFLEKMGIEFGAELNAYTSFDETVYMLSVPSDRFGLVDTALLVLNEWSQNVSMDGTEIDKERGVILSELRQGLGANDRMFRKYLPVIVRGSKYVERLPIGKKELLETFHHDTLRRFYKEWYRPNLMAVSVVGDANVDSVEALIKKYFTTNTNPDGAPQRLIYGVPTNTSPLVSIVTDKENPYSIVSVDYKHAKKKQLVVGDYKNLLVQSLFNGMMNSRFAEETQKPGSPFIQAGARYEEFIGKEWDSYALMAVSKDNRVKESMARLMHMNMQLKNNGFLQSELDRMKKELASSYEQMVKEKDKTPSKSLADEYIRNFLDEECIPGIENEYRYMKEILPSITVEEMNAVAKSWIIDTNMTMVVMLPENENIQIPTEAELLKVIEDTKQTKTDTYVDSFEDKPLVDKSPEPAKVVKRTENEEFGFTEIELSNGAKVVLKPNKWKNEEILYSAVSQGGQAKCKAGEIFNSRITTDLINESGLGGFDNINLGKKLSGINVSIQPTISLDNEGISGSATPKDLETLLQLNYLYFNAPRIDSAVVRTYIDATIASLRFKRTDPRFVYTDSLITYMYNNDKRFTVLADTNEFKKIDTAKVMAFYRERFKNPADFVYIFVGNFKVDSILPSIQTWIGGLATTKDRETTELDRPYFPAGKQRVVIKQGIEPKATVTIITKTPMVWERKQLLQLSVLADVLDIRLRETMREDQGRVYGVHVSQSAKKWKTPEATLKIAFVCAPETVDSLIATIYNEIDKLRRNGPPQIDIDKQHEILSRHLETTVKTNGYWKGSLEMQYNGGFAMESFETKRDRVKSVTVEDIKQAANAFLKMDNVVEGVLLPQQ